jgi:hypothetical protein
MNFWTLLIYVNQESSQYERYGRGLEGNSKSETILKLQITSKLLLNKY